MRSSAPSDFDQVLNIRFIFLLKYPDSPCCGTGGDMWVKFPSSAFVLVSAVPSKKNLSLIQLISRNEEYSLLVLGEWGGNLPEVLLIEKSAELDNESICFTAIDVPHFRIEMVSFILYV